MKPFQTIGQRARWTYVLDAISGIEPGTVVTYEDIAARFPEGDFDRNRDRGAISRAAVELLNTEQRAVEAVRNVGYRVVTAADHYRLAQSHRLAARRKARRSATVASNYRRSEVDEATAARLDTMAARMSELERRLTRAERRTELLDRAVRSGAESQATINSDIDERLARLEQMLSAKASPVAVVA